MLRAHLSSFDSLTVNRSATGPRVALFCAIVLAFLEGKSEAQQVHLPSGQGQYAELSSEGPQKRQGDLFIADKNVDLLYAGLRLRADHLEYNEKTRDALAEGNVRFDYENQHLEGDAARFNFATGIGKFSNVRGTMKI